MYKSKSLAVLILLAAFTISTFASSPITEEKYRQIEDNLLVGLETENLGLNISCAYFLGEMKSDRAVIPLLKMLKGSESEEERIIAALSLAKINSEMGIFAVKQKIKFDDSERVQRLCKLFYNDHLVKEQSGKVIVEPLNIVDLDMEFNGIKLAQFDTK